MRLKGLKRSAVVIASLMLLGVAGNRVWTAPPQERPAPPQVRRLPNPQIMFLGQEPYQVSGKDWIRYKYMVTNSADYPSEMFAAAPDLPPCGTNTKSARTWVDIYEQSGKRLYGFCALAKPGDLNELWFALESGVVPPSYIYIELNDRKTNTKYKSMLVETTE